MGQNSNSYETTVRLNYHPKDQPIRMQSCVTLKKIKMSSAFSHRILLSPAFLELKTNKRLIFSSSILGKQTLLSIRIYNKKKFMKTLTPLTAKLSL